jgi:hypothetical protein
MARISVAAILAALVIGLTPLTAGTSEYTAEEFSSLPDEQRWYLVDEGYTLPDPPPGYVWAEDLTLVPESFYEGTGAQAPTLPHGLDPEVREALSTCDPIREGEITVDLWDELVEAGGWRGDPTDSQEAIYPPECLSLGAEDLVERVGC